MSMVPFVRRLLFGLACVLVAMSACTSTGRLPRNEPAEAIAPTPTESAGPAGMQRGVALSPISYEGTDLPDFLNIVDGSVDLVMHAGDWDELADETSAFRVLSELAGQRDLDTMIVLSPSNGTQLLRPLDEATVTDYLATLDAFLTDYQPRYLGLGNELNLVASRSAADFEQTVALYEQAMAIVRQRSPDTEVFVTVQYEWLLGRRDGWFGRDNDPSLSQWDLLERFASADAIGITTYPGLVHEHPDDMSPGYYDQLRDHTNLPIIITESGWTADPDLAGLAGSEAEQVAFATTLLTRAQHLDVAMVVWTFLFATQVDEPAFSDMGLWRDDGTARPVWLTWTGDIPGAHAPPAVDPDSIPPSIEPPSALSPVWTVPFPGEFVLTAVADTSARPFVYVAAKNGGVAVIRTDSDQGSIVARVATQELGGADAMHLVQQGDTLVVALGDFFGGDNPAGIGVIDIADPTNPQVRGVWISPDRMHGSADVVIDGTVAYLGAMEFGVFAFDVSGASSPRLLGQLRLDPDYPIANPSAIARPNARGLAIAGARLFVANDAGGLRIVDIADPANMRELGRYINPDARTHQAYNDVLVVDGYAFVSLDYCGFEVIDVRDLAAIRQVAWLDPWGCNDRTNLWLNSAGHGNELFFDAARSTIWMSAGDSEVVAIDISDRENPAIVAAVGEPGNERATYGLGATTGVDAHVFATYITAFIPFQGRTSEVVALAPLGPSG